MSKYKLSIKKSAQKDIRKLPRIYIKRVTLAIYELANDPRPSGSKKMSGYTNLWRIRVGVYRVLYTIEDGILTIKVLEIGHRKDIYKD